jgi:hypothetical protein
MGDALFTTSAEFGAALLRRAMPASTAGSA